MYGTYALCCDYLEDGKGSNQSGADKQVAGGGGGNSNSETISILFVLTKKPSLSTATRIKANPLVSVFCLGTCSQEGSCDCVEK